MAYTKYSLTPANNNATPPDGAPEGMLPSAVNDTMRDMMAQIRDVGDGIRNGTYTMTAPVITGGSITGASGSFTTLTATGNTSLDGGSFVFNESGADKDFRIEGDTDANLLFSDASTDRIGIGTSSPAQKLDVNGTANFGNINTGNGISTGSATLELGGLRTGDGTSLIDFHSVSGTDYETRLIRTGGVDGNFTIQNTGVGAFTIRQIGASNLIFDTSNTERMRIDSSGNVGIGTSSPSARLEVAKASGASDIRLSVAGTVYANIYASSSDFTINSVTAIPLTFGTNSTERMRIDSGGNVAIGTSTVRGSLTVAFPDATGNGLVLVNTNSANNTTKYSGVDFAGTDTAGSFKPTGNIRMFPENANYINSALTFSTRRDDIVAERMRITSAGNVGIGITNPTSSLHVANEIAIENTGGYGRIEIGGSSGGYVDLKSPFSDDFDFRLQTTATESYIITNGALPMIFQTNSSERMRITSGGDLLIGTTNTDPIGANVNGIYIRPGLASSFVATSDDVLKIMRRTSTGVLIQFFYNGATSVGTISTNGTTTAYNTTSDYRLKENIAPMTGALEKVAQLKPVTYSWKSDGSDGQGFIAHELQEVCPDAVSGEKDAVDEDGNPKYQGVDTSFLVATLTAAIQEQQAQIEELKAEVQALKAK